MNEEHKNDVRTGEGKMRPQQMIIFILLALVAFLIVWLVIQRSNQFDLPKGGAQPTSKKNDTNGMVEEIQIKQTENVKHAIPLDEILSGGPPKDGIPSIDDPTTVSANNVPEWFEEDGLGISLTIGEIKRFYPYQVLVRHEIVNDTIDGKRILVTYCPLCFTGIVFDPAVRGEDSEFGVSGKLWNSNLLMYNRTGADESLWSQISGKAVVGEHTGEILSVIPSDVTRFSVWKTENPRGDVVVGGKDRGSRAYGASDSVYGDLENIKPIFETSHQDDRLGENAFVMGLEIDGQTKAYHVPAVAKKGDFVDTFAGKKLSVEYDSSFESVRIFEINADGTKERLSSFPSFWFSWVAVHPDTELFK